LDVLLKLLHLDYTIMIQLVYHNGETWHVNAVLEQQQQQQQQQRLRLVAGYISRAQRQTAKMDKLRGSPEVAGQ